MYAGEVVESAPTARAVRRSQAIPTRSGLLRCVPVPGKVPARMSRWAAFPAPCRASAGLRRLRLPRPLRPCAAGTCADAGRRASMRGAGARIPLPAAAG